MIFVYVILLFSIIENMFMDTFAHVFGEKINNKIIENTYADEIHLNHNIESPKLFFRFVSIKCFFFFFFFFATFKVEICVYLMYFIFHQYQ
jgi:hypothetical protein